MGFVTLAVVVLLLVALWLWDRRSRRRGHTLRSGGDMSATRRDRLRDIASTPEHGIPVRNFWNNKPDGRN